MSLVAAKRYIVTRIATKSTKTNLYALLLNGMLIALCLGLSQPTLANSKPFKPVAMSYEVSLQSSRLGNATLGQLKTRLSNTPTGYRVISETKAEGMAAVLLGSSLSEECHFDVIENQAVSRQYQGGSDKKTNYQVGFDWQQRKINFVKGETLDIPKGYVVDNCNLPFAIAATKGESLGEKPLYIIDGKKQRIRGFTLQSQNTEIVDTAIGKISTTKIVMQRELRPDKTLTLWLASDYQFLPIKMQEKRSSRTTTMLLNSWQLLGN